MSLWGDIMLAPKGPVKWGWFSRILSALAQRLQIISADATIQVSNTPSGYSINLPETTTEEETTAWIIRGAGIANTWSCLGGGLAVNDLSFEVPDTVIIATDGKIIALQIDIELSATTFDDTPIFKESVSFGQLSFTSDPAIVAITTTAYDAAQSTLPQSRSTGTIFVPLGYIEGGRVKQWAPTTNCVIQLDHQEFVITFS